MAHRVIRIYANHKRTCHCFICRNVSDEVRDWIMAHQAAFGKGL